MEKFSFFLRCIFMYAAMCCYAQVNLTSLKLQLEPPMINNSDENSTSEPTVHLSLRPDFQRHSILKNPHNNTLATAATIAESALHVLQHYIPTLMTGNASLVDSLSTVTNKLRNTAQTSKYVNPFGLPCNPKEVRLCHSRAQLTSTTTPSVRLFDFLPDDEILQRKEQTKKKRASTKPRSLLITPTSSMKNNGSPFPNTDSTDKQTLFTNLAEKAMAYVMNTYMQLSNDRDNAPFPNDEVNDFEQTPRFISSSSHPNPLSLRSEYSIPSLNADSSIHSIQKATDFEPSRINWSIQSTKPNITTTPDYTSIIPPTRKTPEEYNGALSDQVRKDIFTDSFYNLLKKRHSSVAGVFFKVLNETKHFLEPVADILS